MVLGRKSDPYQESPASTGRHGNEPHTVIVRRSLQQRRLSYPIVRTSFNVMEKSISALV